MKRVSDEELSLVSGGLILRLLNIEENNKEYGYVVAPDDITGLNLEHLTFNNRCCILDRKIDARVVAIQFGYSEEICDLPVTYLQYKELLKNNLFLDLHLLAKE